MRRVLFAFDRYIYTDLPESQTRHIFGEAMYDRFVKTSGTEIELGFFQDDRMKEVSAVIFSNTATFGKVRALVASQPYPIMFSAVRYNDYGLEPTYTRTPKAEYHETLLDGLYLFLSPFAETPFDIEPFLNREVSIHSVDPSTGELLVHSPHGFLFQRVCFTFPSEAIFKGRRPKPQQIKPMIPHSAPPWPEDALHPVKAQVGPFVEHFLAHHRGWTILVVRDTIDNDWGVQAISAKVKTIPQFVRINSENIAQHLMPNDFFATKDDALRIMIEMIDEFESDCPSKRMPK